METLKSLKRTWKYAYGYRRYLFIFIFFGILTTVCNVLNPLLVAQLIIEITNQNVNNLILVGFLIFLFSIGTEVFWLIGSVASNKFSRGVLVKLQCELASETLLLEQKELLTNSSGVFADRINNDCNQVRHVFVELSHTIITTMASLGIMVAVFLVNKYVFCYYVLVLCLISFCNHLRFKYYFKIDKEIRKLNENNTGIVSELIRGLKDIKVLNAIAGFTNKMKERFTTTNNLRYKMVRNNNILWSLIQVVEGLSKFGFIVLAVFLISHNLLAFPAFIVLYTYQDRVFNLLEDFNYITQYLKDYNLSSSRIFEIISHDKFKKETFGDVVLDKASGNFEFKDVCFGYNDKMILKDLNFKISENETVAFVGKSGSGKSTIFNLITKLYEVNDGSITIDGVNINDLTCDSIRGNISLITQDPYIFNFSIKENLSLVKEDLTDEEMIEACKLAQIHDYIITLPDKYDTLVGEGGITLSGGQRQRLAIARALLKKTEIILFDEATSALDNETQKDIQMAINNMKGEYTILIIAHRLSTVINSDRILFVDDGRVIASGTHEELMKNCVEYKSLYETELV